MEIEPKGKSNEVATPAPTLRGFVAVRRFFNGSELLELRTFSTVREVCARSLSSGCSGITVGTGVVVRIAEVTVTEVIR